MGTNKSEYGISSADAMGGVKLKASRSLQYQPIVS